MIAILSNLLLEKSTFTPALNLVILILYGKK